MSYSVILGLAAYCINTKDYFSVQNQDRQEVYAIALNWLYKIIKPEMSVIIADVTVPSSQFLSPKLAQELSNPIIKDMLFLNDNLAGSANKGAGEYQMCKAIVEKHFEYLKKAKWIVYYTSRQICSFALFFDYLNNYNEYDIIVGNPTYFYPNGREEIPASGNYCDMIFAMKPAFFFEYISTMDPNHLIKNSINSETNLYNYVKRSNGKLKEVFRLGVFRYNYQSNGMEII
jgi:hypothetical protein